MIARIAFKQAAKAGFPKERHVKTGIFFKFGY